MHIMLYRYPLTHRGTCCMNRFYYLTAEVGSVVQCLQTEDCHSAAVAVQIDLAMYYLELEDSLKHHHAM